MSKQVPWNKIIVDKFIELSCLTEEEIDVLKTRVINNWTITKQSMELGMSTAKVSKIVARLKAKYDDVQPYSDGVLPERKSSVEETYLDEH